WGAKGSWTWGWSRGGRRRRLDDHPRREETLPTRGARTAQPGEPEPIRRDCARTRRGVENGPGTAEVAGPDGDGPGCLPGGVANFKGLEGVSRTRLDP